MAATARVQISLPARGDLFHSVSNWTRIFCLHSGNWRGAVASLVKNEGDVTIGSVVELSDEQVSLLDKFEVSYHKESMRAMVYSPDGIPEHELDVFAYVADKPSWKGPPSEQYLVAIYRHLREHWRAPGLHIPINRWEEEAGRVQNVSDWTHPGIDKLQLPSLFIELNTRLPEPLVMPRSIRVLEEALAQDSCVSSTADLHDALAVDARADLLRTLKEEGVWNLREMLGRHRVFMYANPATGLGACSMCGPATTDANFLLVSGPGGHLLAAPAPQQGGAGEPVEGQVMVMPPQGLGFVDEIYARWGMKRQRVRVAKRKEEEEEEEKFAWMYVHDPLALLGLVQQDPSNYKMIPARWQ
ncbi:hypothetical protein GUITHDRAFT_109721 [Guillardia theta CCMP2712]|uniref:Gamma-glutamylcyclotransferase AIG2-like domain-containing protein n=1 Tax=Guillardia theta (strain CCMP2712) TaxID=905079 RepID=L1J854_GUITC|nr:hypothetical protein GUITHDRAFT_109721 [Guillardia theta CCMP2712]EKX44264.1 hypothetical protein GUITHDRAFT_109721 [Guillardia theta CCMP2712]|eukprot:XP_005831244.1 hypothetical protein GUITHDRAFT_109721 [Guillardia theta CCMP2712]